MRFCFCALVYSLALLESTTDGFSIAPFQRMARTLSLDRKPEALLRLTERDEPQQKVPHHLYIPDDEEVLKNGLQRANGVAESRMTTSDGAQIYLPDDEYVEGKTQEQQSVRSGDSLSLKGIPFEEIITDEVATFNGMNSNNHVQIDSTTKPIAGKPVALKHLYRYFTDICVDCWLSTVEAKDFLLSCNYTESDIADMEKAFPRLLSLDVKAYLSPHVRFIVRTLGAGTGDICDGQECSIDGTDFIPHNCQVSELGKTEVPPIFFGKRLEKTVVPRKAYLVHYGLPHGKDLLNDNLFQEFLDACDTPASVFAHLCNRWSLASKAAPGPFAAHMLHTSDTVEAFERAFHSGLLTVAKNERSPDLDLIGCSPGGMVELLLRHGANAIEHDRFGTSMLHYAAGTGNLNGARALLKFLVESGEGADAAEVLLNTQEAKAGATPLHWACCGLENGKQFGFGGHANICRLFLDEAGDRAKELANAESYRGSTPLMWAVWSGGLDIVKLLLAKGADPSKRDNDGHNATEWAAAAGHLDVYDYLNELDV